jgi:prephenate dehydrogenase
MDRLMPILATQIWYLPFLAIYILGLVLALSRRDIGKASQYAALGFGLMIVGLLMSSANMYTMITMRDRDNFQISSLAAYSMVFRTVTMLANLGGWGFILAALFAKRPPPPSRVE